MSRDAGARREKKARRVGQVALLFAALAIVAPAAGRADEGDEDAPPKACAHVKGVSFPPADQPDAATAAALKGCNSEALFYGIGQPADPVKARLCAYVERAAGDEVMFGGSGMLMTIYASGVGAEQNLDLAMRLACAFEGAPAEVSGRVGHLEKLKRGHAKNVTSKVTFGLCDDATSGYMEGHCAAHDHRMKEAKREQRLAALTASWSPEEREAWNHLRERAAAFIQAHSANEMDLSGTARAAQQIEEEEDQEKAFDKFLGKLGKGALPRATPAAFAHADAELNATYKAIMAAPANTAYGAVSKEGIRTAERAWVPYRDAWVAFTKVKFPKVDPLATKLWLTRERAAMIADFAPEDPARASSAGD